MRKEETALATLEVAMGSKVGVIWIISPEEFRVERAVAKMARTNKQPYKVRVWSATRGLEDYPDAEGEFAAKKADPGESDLMGALATASAHDGGRVVTIFRDLAPLVKDNPVVTRAVKDAHAAVAKLHRAQAKQIITVTEEEPPKGLSSVFLIEWPLPDRAVLAGVFDELASMLPDKNKPANGEKDEIVGAGLGLTTEQFDIALTKSFVSIQKFSAPAVAEQKRAIVRSGGLEWIEPDPRGLDGIGGLDPLKAWLQSRRSGFGKKAREYGLPAPRGVLMCGVPGAGKSLTAKCVGTAWGLPLLRLDVGNLFAGILGQTESQMRRALSTAEAVAPCILWVDEIEKAFASGGLDGGTSARVLGKFLTWMQDRPEGVFVIATANDIFRLPPEFLREGRWDAKWFINAPTTAERVAIVNVLCKKYSHCEGVDRERVADAAAGYTGAEIEAGIVEALAQAFADGERAVATEDVLGQVAQIVPITKSDRDRIEQLVAGLQGRARFANTPDGSEGAGKGRDIETISIPGSAKPGRN